MLLASLQRDAARGAAHWGAQGFDIGLIGIGFWQGPTPTSILFTLIERPLQTPISESCGQRCLR